ncbi:MAG: noncanonical pyrimidine nucleotidase, YjjG family [Eubacterium sp.]|nr:noncanonical pyrimidine nucleotidase, YjjG family [Eubacterium sp.]
MIKNILFDLDDTILDFHKCERTALTETFKMIGVEHTEKILDRYSVINDMHWKRLEKGELTRAQVLLGRFEVLFEEIGAECSSELAWKTYEELLGNQYFLVEGALDLLEKLYGKYRLYIVSNGTATVQDRRIAGAKLEKYFEKIFISQKIGVNKPNIRFFERCFSEIGDVKKEETIIIGDSLSSDIQGGINAGIKTCWYNPNKNECPKSMCIDYIIHSLDEIEEVIKKEQE